MAPRLKTGFFAITFALAFALCASAKDPERIPAAGNQTIVKEFRKDGTIKTLTRIDNADGSIIAIQYYTPKGRATHADYFDDKKRVRRRVFYREDGTPNIAKEFDEHGKVIFEDEHDRNGNVIKRRPVK
jgi:antitoxin component YwqK of YwqJK toxin-antitoxin module